MRLAKGKDYRPIRVVEAHWGWGRPVGKGLQDVGWLAPLTIGVEEVQSGMGLAWGRDYRPIMVGQANQGWPAGVWGHRRLAG